MGTIWTYWPVVAAQKWGCCAGQRSPNPIPPERVFSILNDTFEDDMVGSHADYIELSLQLQFSDRTRE